MTKEEYKNYIEALNGRGYKFVGNRYYYKYYCYKAIEYRDDEDGNSRAVCQLLFYLFEQEDNRSGYVEYAIKPAVIVSRNTDERLDLTISQPKRSIKDYERIAKEFMEWVDMNIGTLPTINS